MRIARMRPAIVHFRRWTELLQMLGPDEVGVGASGVVGEPEAVGAEADVVGKDLAGHGAGDCSSVMLRVARVVACATGARGAQVYDLRRNEVLRLSIRCSMFDVGCSMFAFPQPQTPYP